MERLYKGGPDSRINEVFIEGTVESTGTQEEFGELFKKVKNSCPIYQMIKAAGVEIHSTMKNIKVE